MPQWRLIGPRIPVPVWFSRLLRARGLEENGKGILWSKVTPKDWDELGNRASGDGRTLLLIHGTGLPSRPGFLGLTSDEYQRLHQRYGGRILAFEHCALTHHLDRNARDLAHALTKGKIAIDLDVVGLSRGGLVARMLTEGWLPLREDIRIHNLIFVGTPNGGTPSARRDPDRAPQMKAWRQDVRRLALDNQRDRPIETYDAPLTINGPEPESPSYLGWPLLLGSQDQLPNSPWLKSLNGFTSSPPHPPHNTTYFGVASVFTFGHGAPNLCLIDQEDRKTICECAIPQTPNDLVVPTTSVYKPHQGPHACGHFPLDLSRLLVLKPSCNATHVGIFRIRAVRQHILSWLNA